MSLLSNFLLEELFEESSKTDFRDKFGEQTLQNFDKARQRLKNKNLSVDYGHPAIILTWLLMSALSVPLIPSVTMSTAVILARFVPF